MPDNPLITISCPRGLRTNGDIISGVLNLNLALAEAKDVVSVTISLRGEIKTQITTRTGESSTTHRDSVRLFTEKQVIWSPGGAVPSHASGVASFPFAFTLPSRMDLPPSFHGGTSTQGGSVQYYLHAVAERKSWYQRNTRVNYVFPFLAVDQNPAHSLSLPQNWQGEWQTFRADKKIRRGLVSHHGLAEIELHMPSLPTIPLFQPIPIHVRVKCTSKPLSSSAENDLEKFDFPRNPTVRDVDLTLRQMCDVKVRSLRRKCTDDLGLQAGFGLPDEKKVRATWGGEVQTVVTPPRWIVDESDKGKGRWSEEVTFSSTLVFRCPPPFSSSILNTSLYLDLDVDFPGLMNHVKTEIGPLPLTSGIPSRQDLSGQDLPPGFAMPQPQPEMDLPPSYYEVIQLDEKAGGARDD